MSQFCFICSKDLAESETVTVDRGLKTLIDASIERGDEFSQYLKDQTSVTVHVQCRKNYTRKSTIAAFKRKQEEEQAGTSKISPPRTRARVSDSFFCFKKCCLFCGNELNEELENRKGLKYRRKICHVTKLSTKETILNIAQTRSDNVAKAAITRIEFEHDLVAAEAKYHKDCFNAFLRPTTGGQTGRPQSETTTLAMEEIFAHIENSDDCQFTLDELQNVCKNSLDNRTIKLRLKLKYGDKIIITEKSGRSTLICFVDILNRASYEKTKTNEKEERFRILQAAAAIIREDIQSAVFDNSHYPPPGRMFEDIKTQIPESVTYFLEKVILKKKRFNIEHLKLACANISHSIMTAVRPEGEDSYPIGEETSDTSLFEPICTQQEEEEDSMDPLDAYESDE